MTRGRIILIAAAVAVIGLIILLFVFGSKKTEQQLFGNLTFWGVFDSEAVMNNVISSYQTLNPGVDITYRQLNPATYESDLVNALAGANPPDLFMVHNSWLPKHFNKMMPFSDQQITLANLRSLFPSVVEQDFAPDNVIFALPLYIDTLAMFYNQDIFDNKGIALPPKNWREFDTIIPKLRTLDKQGRVEKPAAAIGGSNKSVNRATDILNLLMLQAGTAMVEDDFSGASFNSNQGLEALNFYTKFSDPTNPSYTWNDSLAYSIDSFAAGETAVMFNYSHQIAFLREKNPFLNFRVASMLQPESKTQDVNFANYWGLAASNKSPNRFIAQDFILFLTAYPQNSQNYLQLTGKSPALRSLISQYSNNPDLGVFARQALTARSWPQIDNAAVENIFSEMIESVLTGKLAVGRALEEAEGKVTQLMQQRVR